MANRATSRRIIQKVLTRLNSFSSPLLSVRLVGPFHWKAMFGSTCSAMPKNSMKRLRPVTPNLDG